MIKHKSQEERAFSGKDWMSPVWMFLPEVEIFGSSEEPRVRARKNIRRGTQFGPFVGKWTEEPVVQRYALEVSKAKLIISIALWEMIFLMRFT